MPARVEAISRKTLRMILEASRDTYPREFGAILRAEGGVITELLLLPGTVSGNRHAIFQLHMLPADFPVGGTGPPPPAPPPPPPPGGGRARPPSPAHPLRDRVRPEALLPAPPAHLPPQVGLAEEPANLPREGLGVPAVREETRAAA